MLSETMSTNVWSKIKRLSSVALVLSFGTQSIVRVYLSGTRPITANEEWSIRFDGAWTRTVYIGVIDNVILWILNVSVLMAMGALIAAVIVPRLTRRQ